MNIFFPLLSAEQHAQFWEEGYLVVPDILTPEEVDAFLADAQPATSLHGHLSDAQYRALAHHPKIVGGASQLLKGNPRIVQTMFLNKPAQGGRGIALHQDSHYLPNEPNTLMACWVALTDTDADNGGLCVIPGTHKQGLRPAHKAQDEKEHAVWETEHQMRDRNGREWDQTLVSFEMDNIDPESIVRLKVPRGWGVFFTGLTIHGSYSNPSQDRERPAFAIHYVHEDTWVFRTDVQETTPVEV